MLKVPGACVSFRIIEKYIQIYPLDLTEPRSLLMCLREPEDWMRKK